MTYIYQWFGMMSGAAFIQGCMLGLLSPRTWAPVRVPARQEQRQPGQTQHLSSQIRVARRPNCTRPAPQTPAHHPARVSDAPMVQVAQPQARDQH